MLAKTHITAMFIGSNQEENFWICLQRPLSRAENIFMTRA